MIFKVYYKRFLDFINKESPPLLKKIILIFLLVSLIVICIVSYDKSAINKCYEIMVGDWLINYSTGFIRRGLMGTVILDISKLFNARPALIVAIFKIISYSIIYFSAIYIISKAKIFKIAHAFIFTYQTNFMFPLLDFRGSGRKEILLIALFSIFAIKKTVGMKIHSLFFLSASLFALTFIHDALFWFYPLFLLLLSNIFPNSALTFRNCFLILIPSVISTFIVVRHGTKMNLETLDLMTKAIDPVNFHLWSNSITYVTWDFNEQVNSLLRSLKFSSIINLCFTLLLTYLPIHIITKLDNHMLFKKNKFLYALLACLAFQAPLILAKDWGRWIYVDSTLLTLAYFLTLNNKDINLNYSTYSEVNNLSLIQIILTFFILLLFMFTWRLHHCCATGFELTIMNHLKYLF